MPVAQQRALVQAADPADGSVAARCQALGLARSRFYYQPRGESARNMTFLQQQGGKITVSSFESGSESPNLLDLNKSGLINLIAQENKIQKGST